MIDWRDFSGIFIRPGYTDMRKAINGLVVLAQTEMKQNIFGKNVFIFCGKRKRSLKVLYWDRNGFCLWQKRLEIDRYIWPKTPEQVRELTYEDLELLLQGLDFTAKHKDLKYLTVV